MITLSPTSPTYSLPPEFDHIIAVWVLGENPYVLVGVSWLEFSIREEGTEGQPLFYSISPKGEFHVWPLSCEVSLRILWAPKAQEIGEEDYLHEALEVIGRLFSLLEQTKWAIIALDKTGDVVRDLEGAGESSGWEGLLGKLRKEEQEGYNLARRGKCPKSSPTKPVSQSSSA